ncbi:MAG: hypothetical protein JW742_07775 [Candidatus Aminicenantes bacterium]|nr:hypothetical protein [Candidatus Aminicenantes bacterium]
MNDFVDIQGLSAQEKRKLLAEIEDRIARRIKDGLLTEREVREIEEMRLRPLPDILDVQSVYDGRLFDRKS